MSLNKKFLIIGCLGLFMAVALGAFASHGLQNLLSQRQMGTFRTGVTYQFYHCFGLLITSAIAMQLNIPLKWPRILFCIGIVIFSFNCYLYAVTAIKFFALIVPLGGLCFLLAWPGVAWGIYKSKEIQ